MMDKIIHNNYTTYWHIIKEKFICLIKKITPPNGGVKCVMGNYLSTLTLRFSFAGVAVAWP